MVAAIATTPALAARPPRELFSDIFSRDDYRANYDAYPDGRSFVMVRPPARSGRFR